MSDFDDLRGILDDDEDQFDDEDELSFDDFIDEDDEFSYGQEIGATGEFAAVNDGETQPGPVNQFLASMSAQQRLIITVMLFGNILILSLGVLLATGRIG